MASILRLLPAVRTVTLRRHEPARSAVTRPLATRHTFGVLDTALNLAFGAMTKPLAAITSRREALAPSATALRPWRTSKLREALAAGTVAVALAESYSLHVPAEISVTLPALMVHTAGVVDAMVTAEPALDLADAVKGADPRTRAPGSVKVILWVDVSSLPELVDLTASDAEPRPTALRARTRT